MKTFIKRILSIVTASGVWLPKMNGGFTVVTAAAADGEYTYENFKYNVLEDGTVEITELTDNDVSEIRTLEIPETIDGKRVTKFSAEIMYADLIVYPNGCEFTNSFGLEHTKLIKYHTDSGDAVIDEYKLGDHSINANIFIPETIFGNSVSSVEKFSKSDSQFASDNSLAVFCKDQITMPDNIGKILVRYDTNGESCKITSVSGSNENAVLGLFDVNGKKITSISGFDATVGGVAVEEQLADSIQANCPVLSCVKRDTWYDIVKFENVNKNLEIPQRVGNYEFSSSIIPDSLKDKISVSSYINAVYYQENETEVLISNIVIDDNLFIPTTINGKLVTGFTDGYSPDLSGRYYPMAFLPADLCDKKGTPATFTYSYIENSDSISITGYVDGDTWIRGGTALEDLFNKPIDTIVLQDGLDRYGIDENRSKNIVTYQKDAESDTFKITDIKQGGDEKSTVTIPESIGGIAVSGIEETAIKDGVTSIIVPENISVPSTVNAVKYTTNKDGSFTVTSVSTAEGDSGNAEVKFPETIGNSKVETVIANEDVVVKVAETADKIIYKENEGNLTLTVVQKGNNNETVNVPENIGEKPVGTVIVKDGTSVKVPPAADKITYKEDENGKITVTDVQKGENNETVKVPEKIGENPVDSVLVKDEDKDKVDVPNSVGKITYTEDEGGNVTITSVTPATDESGKPKPVTIPDIIGGSEPKISDEVKETIKDIPHTHKTEEIPAVSATCTQPGLTAGAKCSLCGEILAAQNTTSALGHSWNVGVVTTAATCTANGVKTYTCTVCNATKTETVAKLGHTEETLAAVTPTCTTTGLTEGKKCSVCGEIIKAQEVVPKTAHNYVNGKCTACGEIQPDHTHKGGTATCTTQAKCDICGNEYGELAAHSWDGGEITTQPTCAAEGVRTYTCTVCGATKTEPIVKIAHTEETIPAVAPTCTATGLTEGKKCSVCGEIIKAQEIVPTVEHNWQKTSETSATYTSAGKRIYTCSVCEQTKEETIPKLTRPSGGDTRPTSPDTPDEKVPFIKDESGSSGWSAINSKIEDATSGDTVNVDMNGATVVPDSIFEKLKVNDVTAVFDMGDGITWTVNGKDITSDNLTDIDFSVKSDTKNIPVDVVNNITGERYSIQLSLAHNGEFGFKAVLSINLGRENAGQKAALYYYNNGALELISESEITAKGKANLTFTHASDYLIVIGESKPDDPTSDTSDDTLSSTSSDTSSDTSGSSDTSDSSDSFDSSTSDSSESSITESPDNSSETHDTSSTVGDDNNNPNTGYMFSLLPVLLLAGGAMMFAKKSRK